MPHSPHPPCHPVPLHSPSPSCPIGASSPLPCSPSSCGLQSCIVGNSQVFSNPPPFLCLPPSSLRKSQLRGATRRAGGQEVRAAAAAAFSPHAHQHWGGGKAAGVPRYQPRAVRCLCCGVAQRDSQADLPAQGECPPLCSCVRWRPGAATPGARAPARLVFFSLLTNNDVFNPKQRGAASSPLPRTILLLPEGQAARGGGISAKAEPAGLRVPAAASKRCARLASPGPGSLLPASGEAAAPGWRLGTWCCNGGRAGSGHGKPEPAVSRKWYGREEVAAALRSRQENCKPPWKALSRLPAGFPLLSARTVSFVRPSLCVDALKACLISCSPEAGGYAK